MNSRLALVLLVGPLLLPACQRRNPGRVRPAAAEPISAAAVPTVVPPLRIVELFPPSATAGVPFSVQDDGSSSLGVAGTGFTRTTTVYIDGQKLTTNFGSPRAIAGIVPAKLSLTPRRVRIEVRDTAPVERHSQSVWFDILPPRAKGSVPAIRDLFPESTRAGVCFSPMPDGNCSLGIAGTSFGPQTQVLFDGVAVTTIYQGPTAMVALVPTALLATPRRITVSLQDRESPVRPKSVAFDIVP